MLSDDNTKNKNTQEKNVVSMDKFVFSSDDDEILYFSDEQCEDVNQIKHLDEKHDAVKLVINTDEEEPANMMNASLPSLPSVASLPSASPSTKMVYEKPKPMASLFRFFCCCADEEELDCGLEDECDEGCDLVNQDEQPLMRTVYK